MMKIKLIYEFIYTFVTLNIFVGENPFKDINLIFDIHLKHFCQNLWQFMVQMWIVFGNLFK